MQFRVPGVAAVALGFVLVAAPAFAQTSMDDPLDAHDAKRLDRMEKVVRELRAIVFQGKQTGKPVTVQPADTDSRIQDLGNRVSDLEQSLTRINGALETATHAADEARRANADLQAQVKALSDRLAAAEQQAQGAAAPPAAAAAPVPAAAAEPGADKAAASEAFAQARQLMLAGDYDGSEKAFASYVQAYPDTPRTPEARYWWGKTLSVKGADAEAASAYIGAIRGWPKTAWAPDATVELARSLVALKKPQDACSTLTELRRRYPKAPPNITAKAAVTAKAAKCGA